MRRRQRGGPSAGAEPRSEGPGEHELDVNRRYFLAHVEACGDGRPVRVLDFGCGDGELVEVLRANGHDAFGADIFYAGADFDHPRLERYLDEGVIRVIGSDGHLPFPDGWFDLIVSDQVLEHVEDLAAVVSELARVLRPDGTMYHHFPTLETWRDGHSGVPFAHRLRPGPGRTAYLHAMRSVGFGSFKRGATRRQWVRRKVAFLDDHCHYRHLSTIASAFEPDFRVAHQEIEYCRFRAGHRQPLAWLLDRAWLARPEAWIFRRLAFTALAVHPLECTPSRGGDPATAISEAPGSRAASVSAVPATSSPIARTATR